MKRLYALHRTNNKTTPHQSRMFFHFCVGPVETLNGRYVERPVRVRYREPWNLIANGRQTAYRFTRLQNGKRKMRHQHRYHDDTGFAITGVHQYLRKIVT